MNVRKSIVLVSILSLAGLALTSTAATLTMHVVPSVSGDEVSLRFRLRYEGANSLEAEASSLPGVQRRFTIALDAQRFPDFDEPNREPCGNLQDVITIDDPGPGWRTVKPGDEFVEDVRLDELYKGIENILGKCDLVVTWSYKMYTRDQIRFPRMAGSVVILSDRHPLIPVDVRVQGKQWSYKK